METTQLSLTSPKLSFLSSSSTPLSFFISNKLQFMKKPNLSLKLNSSLQKSQFLGTNLGLLVPSDIGRPRFQIGPIRAAVKRRKEMPFEELRVRNEMEDVVVTKLRKLLMMSLEKRILLEKISHLGKDLGLPRKFRDTVCHRYPEFFKVVETGRGPALELTHWDPQLAVSAAELSALDNRIREIEEQNFIIDWAPKSNSVNLPKGLKLNSDIPYISPYSDFSMLRLGTPEKEKHACGVIHEILSLTLEKRTLVGHMTHFRQEFRIFRDVRGMLLRHPDMFYISLKGDSESVFLREAYRDSQLVDKDRLLLTEEKLCSLVQVPRFRKGRGAEEQEWSDADEFNSDSDADDDNDDDWIDDWIDKEDDDADDFNSDSDADDDNDDDWIDDWIDKEDDDDFNSDSDDDDDNDDDCKLLLLQNIMLQSYQS